MSKPIYWKSKDGEKFIYGDYSNVEEYRGGFIPLPQNGYPYTVIYDDYQDKKIMEWLISGLKEYVKKNPDAFKNPLKDNIDKLVLKFTEAEKFRFYKASANWLIGPMRAYMNENALVEIPFIEEWKFIELICIVEFPEHYTELISFNVAAKKVFPEMINTGESAFEVITKLDLIQSNDESEIINIVKSVLEKNLTKVAEYKSGKKNVANMFIGDVMRASGGKKLNPKVVAEIIKIELDK